MIIVFYTFTYIFNIEPLNNPTYNNDFFIYNI